MGLRMLGVILFVSLGGLPLTGQAVGSAVREPNFENDQIRIVHIFLAPHQSVPVQSHPRRFVIALTPSNLRFVYPDGTSKTAAHMARDFYWSEPVSYGVENLSDSEVAEVDIEFKQDKGPGVQAKLPVYTDPRPAGTETDPVPVDREPHHHPVFINQYGKVLNVAINPGETFLYHRHALDHVAIEFESAKLDRQTAGKDWVPGPSVFGHADFGAGYKTPYVHRVKNVDSITEHVLDFDILPCSARISDGGKLFSVVSPYRLHLLCDLCPSPLQIASSSSPARA
jgi:hypothetical protein